MSSFETEGFFLELPWQPIPLVPMYSVWFGEIPLKEPICDKCQEPNCTKNHAEFF